MNTGPAKRLAHAFAGLLGVTYLLLVLGALVRAQGAGLACPDWPLCFGEVVPSFDLKVAFEWTHRLVAGSVSIAFVALAGATLRRPALRRTLARPLAVAAALLVLQILLGALTVWRLLASWTVTSHLLTGNAFAVTLAFAWRDLAERSAPPIRAAPIPAALHGLLWVTGVLLLLQLVLGGLVASTYAGLACPDWPSCLDGAWFPSFEGALGLHLLHRLNGYALFVVLALTAARARRVPRLQVMLLLAALLGLLQIAVGVANVLLALPVEITGLHSALAATLVLLTALSLREAWLSPRRARRTDATHS
ncbi:MAG: COX15/CtaA family protein [Myxococcota bacterium]